MTPCFPLPPPHRIYDFSFQIYLDLVRFLLSIPTLFQALAISSRLDYCKSLLNNLL